MVHSPVLSASGGTFRGEYAQGQFITKVLPRAKQRRRVMVSESDMSRKPEGQKTGKAATKPAVESAKAAEKQRLGEALRENLRRRKAQRQGRVSLASSEPAETAE
jgi:hypothetical protein